MKELTPREQAVNAIGAGGSIFFNNVQYLTVESLPSEADFAAGNPDAEKSAMNSIDAELFRLMKEKEDLQARMGVAKPAATKMSITDDPGAGSKDADKAPSKDADKK